mgnify:CR=1 FL=1
MSLQQGLRIVKHFGISRYDWCRDRHLLDRGNAVLDLDGFAASKAADLIGNQIGSKTAHMHVPAWIKAQPTGAPGRRQMPNFHLNDAELDDLVAFLKYSSEINTNNWPPNIEG